MATSREFMNYVCGQLEGAGEISTKKMFGEYGLYCDGKFIGVICDNQLFIKKTESGASVIPNCEEAPPYEGAKPHFLIDCLEDRETVGELIRATWEEVPFPKPKKKKADRKKENSTL